MHRPSGFRQVHLVHWVPGIAAQYSNPPVIHRAEYDLVQRRAVGHAAFRHLRRHQAQGHRLQADRSTRCRCCSKTFGGPVLHLQVQAHLLQHGREALRLPVLLRLPYKACFRQCRLLPYLPPPHAFLEGVAGLLGQFLEPAQQRQRAVLDRRTAEVPLHIGPGRIQRRLARQLRRVHRPAVLDLPRLGAQAADDVAGDAMPAGADMRGVEGDAAAARRHGQDVLVAGDPLRGVDRQHVAIAQPDLPTAPVPEAVPGYKTFLAVPRR
ncbi:hypothetical protein CR165_21425 [Pseudoroseomonas aestuarii]|uniref:Uncharacterized protein n=1 Tax=Teichococcus aestuarii TaxID=568898 RepID=A0A2U1UYJ9_9PROT|nr:hypothetical protein CR165_21425 [Pseudoroseomonas aestuarii]